MVQVSEEFEFTVRSGILGRDMTVAVQYSGNREQSTGIMFFRGDEILCCLDEDGVADMIVGILKRWKGKRPQKFQDIKSLL